jgi:transposase
MDATHPQHNPVIGCGWIKRGTEYPISSTAGGGSHQWRDNVQTMSAEIRFDETIDAVSTIALFQRLEQANPTAPRIIVFCDNARYYKSKAVAAYLTTSRIQLEPLPPYCQNLNLIERFWKFFKRQVLYNQYYETFDRFRETCKKFFSDLGAFAPQLRTLLAENFQIIGE